VKWPFDEMAIWKQKQNYKLMKWQVDKKDSQGNVNLMKWQFGGIRTNRIIN
jgi:hypothetical protein